jgi:hypothetical protein
MMRLGWFVMGMCLVIACKKDAEVAAWVEVKGQRLLVVPAGDGNTIVVRPQEIQVCPRGAACSPLPTIDNLAGTCPTCEGCNCRLRICAPYCRTEFTKYLEDNYKLDRPTPTPPGPGPDPAPGATPPTTPPATPPNK